MWGGELEGIGEEKMKCVFNHMRKIARFFPTSWLPECLLWAMHIVQLRGAGRSRKLPFPLYEATSAVLHGVALTELFSGLLKPGFKISNTKLEPWAEEAPAQLFIKSKQRRSVMK